MFGSAPSQLRIRKALENKANMEDDRTTALESQLGQAKQIAEEADKKYEEVRKEKSYFASCNVLPCTGLAFSSVADGSQMIYDPKFCDSVTDLLVNLGQFW